MKIILLVVALLPILAFSKTTNLSQSNRPSHYFKREKAILNVGLAYYGDYWKENDLKRITPMLKERFALATNEVLTLNIVAIDVLSYKTKFDPVLMKKTYPQIKDEARLQRVYYYETLKGNILSEVYDEFKKAKLGNSYKSLDALLVVTGAQFDGLGLANGRVAVTEQPREIAWGLPDGGRTEIVSDESIVDELIHELGHIIFLGHTSTQCMKPDLTLEERNQCCEASPSKNDVMSYCRNRNDVNHGVIFGFESCNREMINELIIPAMLKGKRWNVSGRQTCK